MNKTIEEYVRAAYMMDNLRLNLLDLNDYRRFLLNELLKTEKQISKHENFLKILQEDFDL